MKKIYVGCSLTQAPDEFKKFIDELKFELGKKFEILDFLGLEKGDEKEVFKHDSKCVLESDLFLAICDYPSIGLGIELGIAYQARKKNLICYPKNKKISRMVLGMKENDVKIYEYQSLEEVLNFTDTANKEFEA